MHVNVNTVQADRLRERRGALAQVDVKNKFRIGDSLELMTPEGNINFTLRQMENGKAQA